MEQLVLMIKCFGLNFRNGNFPVFEKESANFVAKNDTLVSLTEVRRDQNYWINLTREFIQNYDE